MNIIKTTAPIPFEELKKYFEDETIVFEINISESDLKNDKLLTYISNLDLPISIVWDDENSIEELLICYFNTNTLIDVDELSSIALDILCEYKINPNTEDEFIKNNKEILDIWHRRFDMMVAYALHTTNNYEEWIKSLPVDEEDVTVGINFVNLLKYPETSILINPSEDFQPVYNKKMFDEYLFKGNNLFYYWANENNALFVFNEAISSEELKGEEYRKIVFGPDA